MSDIEINFEIRCPYCPSRYKWGIERKEKCKICLDTGKVPSDLGTDLLRFLVKYTDVKILPKWKDSFFVEH